MKKKIIIASIIILVAYKGCSMWPIYSEFDDKNILEDVMEMQIPDYHRKQYFADSSFDFHGDFSDSIRVVFNHIPSKAFIDSVARRVEADSGKESKRWIKHGEHQYRFQAFYGDGGKTPECRKGMHDCYICLNFSDNSTEAVIEYGYW